MWLSGYTGPRSDVHRSAVRGGELSHTEAERRNSDGLGPAFGQVSKPEQGDKIPFRRQAKAK